MLQRSRTSGENLASGKGTTRCCKSNPANLDAVQAAAVTDVPDILQFACGGYYCAEGESHVHVKVERLGNPDGHASVEYYTVDGSAKAGVKYKAAAGVAKFEPQQTECEIPIELLEDNNFDSVLEFNVCLKNAKGAALDRYLNKSEITIADDDAFPTNAFREDMRNGNSGTHRESILMKEYIKMHMQDKKLWRCTLKTVFCDQIENLELIWNLLLTRYLIDCLLTQEASAPAPFFEPLLKLEVNVQIYFFVFFLILPNPIKWTLQQMKASRRMGGKSRTRLQENLMRKFLNYNQLSRSQMSNADLTMAITRDVPELVSDGLLMIFPIMQKISLLLMYGFMAIRNQPSSGIFFVAFPLLMGIFLWVRLRKTEHLTYELFESQTRMVGFVQRVTDFFRIIADYGQKQETVAHFHNVVVDFNDHMHEWHCRRVTNFAFAPLLTNIFVALYVILYYTKVHDADGGMTLGDFVTGVGIWKGVGGCYQGMYENVLTMQDALSCLHNICFYMNLPLDVVERKQALGNLLAELDKAQDASCALFYDGKSTDCSLVAPTTYLTSGDIVEKAGYSQDLIQIDCQNVKFSWPAHGMVPEKMILANANFEISQGQLTGIIGGAGSGKATLLQLLAGVLVPESGSGLFFVPPHLRLLHVTCEPIIFFDCSLWANLLYGEVAEDDADPKRVMRICRQMGMSDDVMAALTGQSQVHQEQQQSAKIIGTGDSVANRKNAEDKARSIASVSHKDRCLLHLARALIVNPDLLIMHKPLTQFHSVDVQRVLEVFRTFVDMRGLEQPVEMRSTRRPRTCIMSLASLEGVEVFDLVLRIGDGNVQEVNIAGVEDLQKRTHSIIEKLDVNHDGYVDREEFVTEVGKDDEIAFLFDIVLSQGSAESVKEELGLAFDKIDFNGSGIISTDELAECLHQKVQDHAPTLQSKGASRTSRRSQVIAPGNQNGHSASDIQHAPGQDVTCDVPEDVFATYDNVYLRLSNLPQTPQGVSTEKYH